MTEPKTCDLCGRETWQSRIAYGPPMEHHEIERFCLGPGAHPTECTRVARGRISDLQAQLTAATERALRAEAERDGAKAAWKGADMQLRESQQRALDARRERDASETETANRIAAWIGEQRVPFGTGLADRIARGEWKKT